MKFKLAVPLLFTLALASCGSRSPDYEACASGKEPDARIAACTRLITAEQLSSPDLANALHFRGTAWAAKRDHDRAIADFDAALRANPILALAHYDRFMARQEKSDNNRASTSGKAGKETKEAKAQPAKPKAVQDHVMRGLEWANKGDQDRAIAEYNEALRVNPQDARAYVFRGSAWSNKHEYARAVADYNEAMRLNPQHLDAHNSAAWLLATAPVASVRNGARAVEVARKAAELSNWKDGNVIDTLAAAYAESGNFPEAVRWQEKAMGFPEFVKSQGDDAGERLELYRKGRPFRLPNP